MTTTSEPAIREHVRRIVEPGYVAACDREGFASFRLPWQDDVEPYRDRGPLSSLGVRFLPGRIRFGHPETWQTPPKGDRPPFGLCLLVWTRR